jgi:hypothetical protein
MRFSNKIPEYFRVSVLLVIGQKSPAERLFVGGVFALLFCYIGNAAGLLYCLLFSALFILRFWSIGVRHYFWSATRSHTLSSARAHTLPPALSHTRIPTFTFRLHWTTGLPPILRCKPLWLHTSARSAHAFGAKLSSSTVHSAALRSWASALETSASSTLHCHASALHSWASALEASATPTLHCHASALEASATSALHSLTSALETSTLSATNVLVRSLAEWTFLTFRALGSVRLYTFGILAHPWSAGHSAFPSVTAAATATYRLCKRCAGQKRYYQHKNNHCFESCLFHFRFLSLMIRSTAFLSPILGFFCKDSGAGGKMVTPVVNFFEKNP